MNAILYALACVALPALWGVAMHYAFAWLLRRRGGLGRANASSSEVRPDRTPIDYEI